jgi:hypothetical protein
MYTTEAKPANPIHKKHNTRRNMTTSPVVLGRLGRGYAANFALTEFLEVRKESRNKYCN